MLAGAAAIDGLARPRAAGRFPLQIRRPAGLWLLFWVTAALFGAALALCGSVPVAAALALALSALLLVASNAKHAMLGEPLLFSDLALVGAIFRHPQFYLSAVGLWQRVAAALGLAALLAVLAWFYVSDPLPHLAGLAIMAGGIGALALSLRLPQFRALATLPAAHADVQALGLIPTLLLYWLRWRTSADPAPCPPQCPAAPRAAAEEPAPEVIVVIQCESFADPAELFAGAPFAAADLALPGLASARAHAWQWGQLQVSGFGAYTMRTEYGVLFGREEADLGFRRYDPFLTALGETTYALPNRLKGAGWRSLFLHPHDMRFYGRDRIMPASGFAELVGEDRFAAPQAGQGRYVTDAAMAERIGALVRDAPPRSLLYAVTIENHGPWAPEDMAADDTLAGPAAGASHLVRSYLRLVRHSDAMLAELTQTLAQLRRPAMLVFFGDHRPSIPGAAMPGGDRHTPYVMVRMDGAGRIVPGDNRRVDMSPAGLHAAIVDVVLGPQAKG